MTDAHAAILRDYPRRVRFPVILVLSGLCLLPMLKGYIEKTDWRGEYGFLIGCLILIVWTGMVSGHLKQVLARPQSRLLPGYARSQVQVALLLIVPALLIGVAGSLLVGFSPLGACSITLFLASIYWSFPYLFNRGGILMLFGPTLMWWVTVLGEQPRLRSWPRWATLGAREETLFALLLVLALSMGLFVTRRMLRLTESSFEYRNDPSIAWRQNSSPDSDMPFINFFQRILPWFGKYRIRARTSIFDGGRWERIGHWRQGMGPRSPIVSGLAMAGITAFVGAFFLFYDDKPSSVSSGILVAYLFMFPFTRYSYTQRRRARFATESLFPVSRENFVREMGWASAVDILLSWFFLCLGIAVTRGLGLFASISWEVFLVLVWFSLGTTFFGIGVTPWILQLNGDKLPSFVLTIIVLIAGLTMILLLYNLIGINRPLVWMTSTPIFAALGAISARHGYRRWCSLELGRESF